MERRMRALVQRSTIIAGVFVLAGCVAPAQDGGDEPTASQAEAVDTLAPDEGIAPNDKDFTFFLVNRSRDGYVVRALNGRRQRCADGWTSDACFVSSIDLVPALFSAADAKTVLGEVG